MAPNFTVASVLGKTAISSCQQRNLYQILPIIFVKTIIASLTLSRLQPPCVELKQGA